MNLFEDELSISHHMEEKSINGAYNRKIFLIPTRKEVDYRILYATCEINTLFYVNYYLIHTRN